MRQQNAARRAQCLGRQELGVRAFVLRVHKRRRVDLHLLAPPMAPVSR